MGVAGALFVGPWTAVLLVAAWLTRVSILIEYEAAPTKVEEAVEEVAADAVRIGMRVRSRVHTPGDGAPPYPVFVPEAA